MNNDMHSCKLSNTRTLGPVRNIGIVTTWFERGAAHVSRAFLEALAPAHNVFIYARGGEQYARGDPSWDREYVTWGKRIRIGIPNYINWPDFRRWVETNQLDVIIFNEQQSFDVVLKCLRLDIVIGSYVDYYTPQTVPFFDLFDFLICNTQRHYSLFRDHPQAIYIPWGTNLDRFKSQPEPVSSSEIVFFHSCGLSPKRKGTDLLVEAFRRIQGPARLIIHSQHAIEDVDLIEKIDEDHRIQLITQVVGLPGLYHLGDVYVYPTRLEGIGLTIAEALASGLPVITTDNPPMNEFVEDDVNGRLVSVAGYNTRPDGYFWKEAVCDLQALASAMQYYVDHRDRIQIYKNQARKVAEERFDWQENARWLPVWMSRIKRLEKTYALAMAAAIHEYKSYPGQMIKALIRRCTENG